MKSYASSARSLLLVAAVVWCASCAVPTARVHVRAPATHLLRMPEPADPAPIDLPGLANVMAFHDGVLSGSAPSSEGLDTLSALCVRTIISVDGAVPDVNRATAAGIRSVHLPVGYNGFDEARMMQLSRAVRDARRIGPVYIHCHHGKHRSAAVAATTAVALGWDSPDHMVQRMESAGASRAYPGLYAEAAQATRIAAAALDAVPANFPSATRPSGLTANMVEIDRTHDRLARIEDAGWRVPTDHPDLVPPAEAARLADLLRALEDDPDVARRPAGFTDALRDCGRLALELERLLVDGAKRADVSSAWGRVNDSCRDCHTVFRDR